MCVCVHACMHAYVCCLDVLCCVDIEVVVQVRSGKVWRIQCMICVVWVNKWVLPIWFILFRLVRCAI